MEIDTIPPTLVTPNVGPTNEEERGIKERPPPITPSNIASNITLNNQSPSVTPRHIEMQTVDEAFVTTNYSQLEPLMRKRMRALRLQGVTTRLNYSSEYVDEEREMEAPPEIELKSQIEEAVKSGKLAHLIKGIRKGKAKQMDTQLGEWIAPTVKAEPTTKGKEEPILMIWVVNNPLKRKEPPKIRSIEEMIFPPIRNRAPSVDPILISVQVYGRHV
ncbi:hypothetical protein Tco_0520314 [Tanacetum coccineum]